MHVEVTDRLPLSGVTLRADGYLLAAAAVARSGIQLYRGSELGVDQDVVRIYRPADEVFAHEAMASFAHRPVTNDHPPVRVDASNWRQYAVGQTSGEVARDGDLLRIPLMVADGEAIADITSGKRELSAGYRARIDWTAGVTDAGEAYDAIQREITCNHVAIVDRGRAGPQCRIGDSFIGGTMTDTPTTDATDDVAETEVEATDHDEKVAELVADHDAAVAKLVADHDAKVAKLVADHDAKVAELTAQLDAAREGRLTPEALAKLVADRVALEATARKIAPSVDVSGMGDHDARVAVVRHVVGDKIASDKYENTHYVSARFDILAEAADGADPVRAAIKTTKPLPLGQHAARDAAYAEMLRLNATIA